MIDEKKLIEDIKEWNTTMEIDWTSDSVISLLESAPKVNQWIPCSERLPDEKGWYLVYAKNQRPFVAYFKGKTFPLNNHYHEIIAWMPLPEPYIEPNED